MSAPAVVNQYPMWVVFQQQAAQAHRFGAKERRTAIAYVAVHGAQDGSAQTHMPIAQYRVYRAVLILGACTRWNDRCGSCGNGVVLPSSSAVHIAACYLLLTWRARAAVRPTLSPPSTVITGAKWHRSG